MLNNAEKRRGLDEKDRDANEEIRRRCGVKNITEEDREA